MDVEDSTPVFHVPTTALDGFKIYNVYVFLVEPNQPSGFDVYIYWKSPCDTTGDTLYGYGAAISCEYNNTEWLHTGFENFVMPGSIVLTNGPFANPFLYQRLKGHAVNPGIAPDDGSSDMKVRLAWMAVNSPSVYLSAVEGQFQDLELQRSPTPPASVPAPLPILGLAAAFGAVRKASWCAARLKALSSD